MGVVSSLGEDIGIKIVEIMIEKYNWDLIALQEAQIIKRKDKIYVTYKNHAIEITLSQGEWAG